jgi:hypothetical protein
VLLGRRCSMRGRRRCWYRWHRNVLLRRRRAGDLALQQSEVALSLPDVEVDGVGSGEGWNCVLLLGWLRLRRGWARLLLLLGRCGLACDESLDPRRASMSCAEAPSPSRLTSNIPEAVCSTSGALSPAPVPAEGWTAEADGLAGSDASGGIDA